MGFAWHSLCSDWTIFPFIIVQHDLSQDIFDVAFAGGFTSLFKRKF